MSAFSVSEVGHGRRGFLVGVGCTVLAGALSGTGKSLAQEPRAALPVPDFADLASLYAARSDGGHQLPAIPYQKIDQRYHRQVVRSPSLARPGSILVDANSQVPLFPARRRQGDPLWRQPREGRLRLDRLGHRSV